MIKPTSRNGEVLLRKRKRKLPSSFAPPKALVIFVKLNGKPDTGTRVVGLTLDEFLTSSTQILRLTSAARKFYLTDGTLVDSIDQLRNNPEVFVSQGEPFIDTVKLLKETLAVRDLSFWGLNGLYLPKVKPKRPNSNREIEQSNKVRRVLTFVNGEYFLTSAFEVISDLNNLEKFLSLCDAKHNANGHSKRVFGSNGSEITDLSTLINDESYIWNPNSGSSVLGPVWVSSSDEIDESAIYQYFRNVTDEITHFLEKEKLHLSELRAMTKGDLDNVHTSSIKSYSKKELKVRRNDSEVKVNKLKNDRNRFRSRLDTLSERPTKETCTGTKQSTNNHFKSSPGLKLKIYTNGQTQEPVVFFFNVEQAKKGIKDSFLLFDRLLDDLSNNIHLTQANDHSRGILVRRLFTENGVEIKDVSSLVYGQIVCISHGENWINLKSFSLSGKLHFMDEDLKEWSADKDGLNNYDVSTKMSEKHLMYDLPVLQNQKVPRNYLMVSLSVSERTSNNECVENWSFTKSGRLYLKRIPSLSLTLLEEGKVTVKFPEATLPSNNGDAFFDRICYIVQLYPIRSNNPYQLWEYTASGHLICKGLPSLHLTNIPNRSIASHYSFFDIVTNINICATELLPEPLDSNQRWGFKHCDQWKLCDLPNNDWHKAKLIWPLKPNGSFNDDLKWPLEGTLIAMAPQATKYGVFSDTRFPIKLNVVKNNDHRNDKAVLITGPDLTKLVRIHRHDKYETHCSNESLLRQEFEMFLNICTGTLQLPSAARRLFNKDGKELTTLEGLSNYDYVCVSMGEMWCSPEKMLTKIQLRSYTNKLTTDVERLKNFITLHEPSAEYVLGVNNNILEEGSIFVVQIMNEMSKKELHQLNKEDGLITVIEPIKEPSESDIPKYKTVHEKTCDAAKLRYSKNSDSTQLVVAIETVSNDGPRKSEEQFPSFNMQQFSYEDNFILISLSSPRFYLCANDIGKHVSFKRITPITDTSPYKWLVHKSGIIESLFYRGFVLTISCPKMLPFQDKSTGEYNCNHITLNKAVNTKYGNALQHFHIASRGGFIYPLFTNNVDKGITSAILSSICTRFVSSKPINQQGYMVEMKKGTNLEAKSLPLCLSCVSILNGRFPITPIEDCRRSFICSYSGGFKVIRNVDLSFEKARDTYEFYVQKLQDLKEQLTLKPYKNRITAAPVKNIKVLLYRNGLGRVNPPQVATGKTINQIMEMATNIFNLQRPVRILYTNNGSSIVDDLSFINIMCNYPVKDLLQESRDIDNNDVTTTEKESVTKDESLKVTLSEDGSYFMVQLGDNSPTTLYSIEIYISKIVGINQFQRELRTPNLYFLINYEIFNNQINSGLFRNDDDFESEVTELTIKSSDSALRRLFREDLAVLRIQVISATVDRAETDLEDTKLDIKSINAFVDVNLTKIVDGIPNIKETMICPLFSTESFGPTTATITIEVSVKMIGDNPQKKTEDLDSSESESIIMPPMYIPDSHPIELWASTGEPFLFPSECESKSPRRTKMDQLKLEIYNKKCLLRNIKGDRINKLNRGTLEATGDGKNPVMIRGNWMFPSKQERELVDEIDILEKQLAEKKKPQTIGPIVSSVSSSLYTQRHMRNCLVYLNGDKETNAISVWGETVYDMMNNAASLLKMKKTPMFLFKSDGSRIESVEEITPGTKLALSHHATFISAEDARLQCEIKANWSRARSKHGEKSTELEVRHRPITVIDVDPFEPPDIMKPREAISKDYKTFSVFENGQPSSGAFLINGNSFPDVQRKAAVALSLTAPVKCFYTLDGKRITNFKEILNEDILAASVTGKGFVRNDDV